MQNQHLKSYKDEFSAIADEGIKLCRKYEKMLPDNDPAREKIKSVADRIEKNKKDRFSDFTPKIMLYGIFNAGKSTLLNALIGKEMAAMADVPTTTIVQEYDWKEYTIFDTPGIDAPIAHEKVSKEKLQECDVILFVATTRGGFSLGKNYQELVDILKSGKRLLIVLNNKSGNKLMSDEMEIKKIKDNIYFQFAEAYGESTQEELQERISIILVNAKTALNARINYPDQSMEREGMLARSNIAELEDAIIAEYKKTNGFTILNELSIQLNKGLEELLSFLESSIKDKDGKHSEESKIREGLRDLQDNLIMKVREYIEDDADRLGKGISNIIWEAKNEGHVDDDEIRNDIQKKAKQWAEQINDFMIEARENISPRYKELMEEFSERLKVKSGDIGSINLPESTPVEVDTDLEDIDNLAPHRSKTKSIGNIVSEAYGDGKKAETSINSILAVASELPLIGEAVGSLSTTISPYIAPVVIGISLFIQLFGDDDEEEPDDDRGEEIRAENEAERRRMMQKKRLMREIEETSHRLSMRLSTAMISRASTSITKWFAPAMERLDKSIAGNSKETETINNDIRAAEQLKAQLDDQIVAYRNM